MKTLRFCWPFACYALLASVALGADAAAPGPAKDPELERRAFKVVDGFDVTLFASEPMLKKPINMNFDAGGRLWVASSETYPQLAPGEVPRDRVYVLEDTDGDGRADKSTVFAENLFIPTGIEVGDGGAYVANSTQLLHLKDTDGDGKADQRRVVLSGFGTEDTHHIIHCFRWDPHGRLNFWQSIYIGSRVETPHGTKVLLGGGVWRLRPETMEVGVFVTGLVNGWGIAWDQWGQAFGTDGAGGEGINYLLPGAAFTATPGAQRVLPGLNPNSPKYCANEIISGRHFPDDWQGDIITNDFRANRVVRFKVSDAGAGYKSEIQRPEVISSTDKAFRPVDVKIGPDGALYIADWYNPVINHGEVDFRSPQRDKLHGRIWRITAKGRPVLQRPKVAGAKTEELLDLLLVPEQWTRRHAKLQLRERGAKEVVPALSKWVKTLTLQSRSNNLDLARLEALWTYENVDHVEPTLLGELLKSPNSNARAAAVRVASHWVKQLDNPMDLLAPLVTDEHPRVRMEAVRAMMGVGTPEAMPVAMRAMDKPVDPFIDYAMYKTANDLKDVWLPAFRAGRLGTWGNAKHLNFALQAVKSADALKNLLAQLDGNQIPPDSRKDVYEMIASIGTPEDLSMLLSRAALREDLEPASRAAAFRAVERGVRQRKLQVQEPYEDRYRPVLESKDPELLAAALRTAPLLGMNVRPELEKAASSRQTPQVVRMAAVEALAGQGNDSRKSAEFLKGLLKPEHPPQVRGAAVAGLAYIDVKAAAQSAGDLFASAKPEDNMMPVIAAFLKKEGGAEALAQGLSGKTIPADVAKLSLRYVQGTGQNVGPLSGVLSESAGITGGARQVSAEELKQIAADVAAKGDPARGEAVFRSVSAQCFQCHALAGAGGTLAPDLRSIGAASPVEYIVESLLDPNKAIKDGYSSLIVTTKDGDLVHGIKVREDGNDLVLRDNLRDEIAIPVASIKSRKDGGSLMPAGLTDTMTRAELVDLVRFLTELGKPGPYALPNEPVVRRWRVMDPVPRNLAEGEPKLPPTSSSQGQMPVWFPAYAMASGVLPAEALGKDTAVGFARCEVEATEPGKVRLVLNSPKGLTLWVGEKQTPLDGTEAVVDLPRGAHVLTLRVDRPARNNDGIRLDLADAPGSAGHVQPVGGR